jgi:anti-sigma factor RsiW
MTAPRPDHQAWEELAVGYALDALEPDETAAMEDHLLTCARYNRAVAETREVTSGLAAAARSVEPPARLRQSILAAVEAEEEPREPAPAAEPVSLAERRRRPVLAWVAAAAVLVLLAGLVGWNLALRSDRDRAARSLAAATAVVNCLHESGCAAVPLQPTAPSRPGQAIALVRGTSVSLVVEGLPPNDTRRTTYVVWQRAGNTLSAIGTFDVTTTSRTVVAGAGHLSQPPTVVNLLAVSREQGRVAPPAPSTPLLAGPVHV